MTRCNDCYWFRNKFKNGRYNVCCADLGELPTNSVCENYEDKKDHGFPEAIKNIDNENLKKARAILYNKTGEDRQKLIENIISQVFDIEQSVNNAILEISRILEQQGISINFDFQVVNKYSDKLSDLFLLNQLCHAYGLSPYLNDIMKLEIQKKFGSAPTQTKSVDIPLR